MDVVPLDGETDYRLQCFDGMPVYYTPLGASADAEMQTAWTRLTHVERGEPTTLEVKGRTIPVPQAAKGVARFSFADLCEQPLGAADFLKVARNFHTVFLDHIPALGPAKRNEARVRQSDRQPLLQQGQADCVRGHRAGGNLSGGRRHVRIRPHGIAPVRNAVVGLHGARPRRGVTVGLAFIQALPLR